MVRQTRLVLILLFLIPFPFITTNCLASFSAKFMDFDDNAFQQLRQSLSKFRLQQVKSIALVAGLLVLSLTVTYCFDILSGIPYFAILSAIFLTHAAFGQLGWEIQTWGGGSVMEIINKWWFRVLYSTGVMFLFVALLSGK